MEIHTLKFFIPSVTDINLPTQIGGWTPLMEAVIGNQPTDFVQVLINYQADANLVNKENFLTPLHLCLLQKKVDPDYSQKMYAYLVQHGARIISTTFLNALDNEKTQHVMKLFQFTSEEICTFSQDVKMAGAKELLSALSLSKVRKLTIFSIQKIYPES